MDRVSRPRRKIPLPSSDVSEGEGEDQGEG